VKKLLVFLFVFFSLIGTATHNRAGEILYKRIAPFTANVGGTIVQVYTYSFTLIKYTDHGQNIADRCEDTLYFGDGTKGVARRVNGATSGCGCGAGIGCGQIIIPDPQFTVKLNTYTITHTYAGPGSYLVRSFDPNRNAGVINIPNSVDRPFYVESLLIINNFTGANSSPQFNFPPTDRACYQQCFYHNPGAFDADGDSLSFEISTSRGENGLTVPGYSYPATGAGGYYGIDSVTGILTWCTPQLQGEYNLAFVVKEWRKNTSGKYQLIGYVLRDMQVVVITCNNTPPFVVIPSDTCVEAGTVISKTLTITDAQNHIVNLTGGGGSFAASAPKAALSFTSSATTYTSVYTWQTNCDHIRQQPYINVIKAEDQGTPKLVYFTSFNVKVVPPSVKNVSATPIGSNIKIDWTLSTCNSSNNPIVAYHIYRKSDCSPLIQDPCKTGIQPSSGLTFIGQTPAQINTFIDTNGGNGLVVGQDYSYVVVAVYRDGSTSLASSQVCTRLKRDVPILLNVDILSTSVNTGSVFVRWARPLTTSGNLDTVALPGPYQFNLKHRSANTASFVTVYSTTQNHLPLLDTHYVHSNLNTVETNHQYLVEFIAGNVTVGNSQVATSVFLNALPGDRKVNLNWQSTTPWNNYKYTVLRKDPGSSAYSPVGTTTLTAFIDSNNVANRAAYCYKILSEGKYSDNSIFSPLLNNSQEICATAVDNTPPCTPTVVISADCPRGFVSVTWNNVSLSCSDDVVKYVLFRKDTEDSDYSVVDTLYGAGNTVFTFDGLEQISGCFAIQAVDSSANLSALSQDYCIDNCPLFELPNIITINGDNANDFFKAIRVRHIKEIDLYVYDRWGNLVFKTKDPYFKWDGTSILTNQIVSEGTFFYVCDVYEPRVNGIKKRNLNGYLQVVR
jgi:gliding motility-associated-like protein